MRDRLLGFEGEFEIASGNPGMFARKRLRSLSRLSQLVSSSLDTDEVLAGIARAAAALMGVPVVSVWVAETESETLRSRAFSDEPVGAAYPLRTIAFGQGPIGVVAVERETLSIPDVMSDSRLLAVAWWREYGLTSFLGVLWSLSGPLVIPVAGYSLTIPGYMVWSALLYAATGSLLTWRIGRPFVRLGGRC